MAFPAACSRGSGAVEADFVASVSESYLRSDVMPFLGAGREEKSGFIYNSCDWERREDYPERAQEEFAEDGRTSKHRDPPESDFRRYLLTRALGETRTPSSRRATCARSSRVFRVGRYGLFLVTAHSC